MNKPTTTFERRQAILQLLRERASVKVADLAAWLDVSEGTIRNDLESLDEQQQLLRVRGGAVAKEQYIDQPRALRAKARVHSDEKRWLAQWAAGMIENGDVILLDASTTVLHIAAYLGDRRNLTIFTNGVEVARLLATDPSNTVILLGGMLRPDGNAITGTLWQPILKDFHIQTAFFSCSGFAPQVGFMEADLQEVQLKRQMLQASQRRIALVDASKIGKLGLTPFATLHDVDYVVTDTNTPRDVVEEIRRSNTHVVVCGEKTVSSYTPYGSQNYYKIGFANMSESLPFSRDVRRGLERAAKTSNRVELIVADNQLNPETALLVADYLIDQKPDLVIEYQVDEHTGNLISNKFKQAGIPIIAVDIPMVGATFLGVDNYGTGQVAGVALGEAVQRAWDGRYDCLIVLEHPRTGYLPAMRIQAQLEGFRSVLGDVPEEKIIYLDCGNTPEVSYEETFKTLQALPHAQRVPIICFNDEAAIGALEAAQKLGREDHVLIVGQGADRRLRDELRRPHTRIIGSTAFHPDRYGEKLIEIALKILSGEPVPPAVYIQHTFIDADNVDQHYPPLEER